MHEFLTTNHDFGRCVLRELIGRAEPRFDRKAQRLELLGAWGDTSRLQEALADLAAWLGADTIEGWQTTS